MFAFSVEQFPLLYEKETVSYNVHGVVHLATDLLTFGPLDEFAAIDSESFPCKLKRLVRSGREPLEQLPNRAMEPKETFLQPKKYQYYLHNGTRCWDTC